MLGRTFTKIISPFLIFQIWCFIYQKTSHCTGLRMLPYVHFTFALSDITDMLIRTLCAQIIRWKFASLLSACWMRSSLLSFTFGQYILNRRATFKSRSRTSFERYRTLRNTPSRKLNTYTNNEGLDELASLAHPTTKVNVNTTATPLTDAHFGLRNKFFT